MEKVRKKSAFGRAGVSRKIFVISNTAFMVIVSLLFLIPYWIIISSSLTAETELATHGITLWPREFSFQAYVFLMTSDTLILSSILNSLFITVVGTLLSVLVCCFFAYPLAFPDLKGKKIITFFLVFTMLFSGGLIPTYLTVKSYGLSDSLWAIILPGLMSAWNVILIRNYFRTIPLSISESAQLDGASEFRIILQFYMPLSMPMVATIILFCAVGFWNNWFGPLLYIETESKYPVQYMIRQMLNSINNSVGPGSGGSSTGFNPQISSRMAAIVISSLPIICVYPFLQKYFINGVIIGSVKE